jgi:DNA-binding MarR family transcriptional regulator
MIEQADSPLPTLDIRIDPAIIAWLRLARVYQKIDRRTDEMMKGYGLSVSRFDILNHAGTPEGRTQQELAEALLVTKGNVTQLLDAMERDGLLERRRDGRAKRIYLTDTGRALRTRVVALQEAAIAAEFSALAPDDLESLARILRVLDRSMQGPP